jgi:hypothetical protein
MAETTQFWKIAPTLCWRPNQKILRFILLYLLFVSLGEAQGVEKVYHNQKFGYTASYPQDWFPSGINYSNAFEILNVDPQNSQSVPTRNQATLTIVDTVNDSADSTDKFLAGLTATRVPPPGRGEGAGTELTIDGHRAVRIRRRAPGKLPSRVTRRLQRQSETPGYYYYIATYIADGKHLISMEASAPIEADATVINEIVAIQDSIRFDH